MQCTHTMAQLKKVEVMHCSSYEKQTKVKSKIVCVYVKTIEWYIVQTMKKLKKGVLYFSHCIRTEIKLKA